MSATRAFNVIPAEATARFNVRFNDRWSPRASSSFLRAELDAAADGAHYELTVEPAQANRS